MKQLEIALGSKNRIKILSYLSENGPANISQIVYHCGINYTSAERHLTTLIKTGLIKEKRYSKIRIFEARFSSLEISFIENEGLVYDLTPNIGEKLVLGVPLPVEICVKKIEHVGPYPLTVTDVLRATVKTRDDYKCVLCGKTEKEHLNEYNTLLTVHHINEIRSDNFKENLVTLCKKCHVQIHKKSTKEELINKVKTRIIE